MTQIETDQGPLYWYKQSHLLMHKDRIYAVDIFNYLGGLMLREVSTYKIPVTLTYPEVPFCPPHYLLRIHYNTDPRNKIKNRISNEITSTGMVFFTMRHMPGDPGYIPHKRGCLRDFLAQSVRRIRDWMRDTARERIRSKILALTMGLHPRLGANSPLLELGSDLLWSVAIILKKQ
jgi:hypothetical protein